jgi:hypothetical protein
VSSFESPGFPATPSPSDLVTGASEQGPSGALPAMTDLDALQIDLDRIDSVLAELDR